ncbi:YtxH domain-containing protein [Dictyobacter kobayashii]|uniref:YtxH domain-containing protein n=1 Tax=Dictyobacter kobayashii TaxID=2014872 RepID=UPI000F82F226|nr:YtxH domain-containing protein [Dictyobacter kobayashii]
MGKFLQGMLIGAAAGLLIAPMRGEELRNKVKVRIKQLQDKASSSNLPLNATGTYSSSYSRMAGKSGVADNEPITLPTGAFEKPRDTSAPSFAVGTTPPPPRTTSPSPDITQPRTPSSPPSSTSIPGTQSSNSGSSAMPERPRPFSTSSSSTTNSASSNIASGNKANLGAQGPSSSSMQKPSTSMPPTEKNLSASGTTRTRRYKYESTLEEMDYEPLILPVETFEEPRSTRSAGAKHSSSSATNSNLNRYPGDKPRH